MPRNRSPLGHSKYEGDRRRERSMSINSRNRSTEMEHSIMQYKKKKTESHERFSRDREKSHNRRSVYRQDDRKSMGDDYFVNHFDDYKKSIRDMEESVDPSICNFLGSALENDILEHKKYSGDDRLIRLEKIMSEIVQNSRTTSEQSGRHYSTEEHDRDNSNNRLKNLEKMIEKIVKRKTETSTFTAPTEPNGSVTSGELIPRNSNFTTSMWLNKINEECLERNFDEKTCIKYLESKMTGSVKSWYKTLSVNDLTWPELKMLITQTFPDNSEFASTLRLLVNRFKKPNETITQYYFSKMYLIEACRISGVFAVSCLIDGLTDPKIQRDAKIYDFLTPESLYSHYLDKLPTHDEPSHKGDMDQPNHKVDPPNHRTEHEKRHVRQPNSPNVDPDFKWERPYSPNYRVGQPNSPNVDPDFKWERPYSPNYRVGQPNLPNYRMGQPYFNEEFRIGQHPHHNFVHDYGIAHPLPPNFEMGPNYGMKPWHPDPYSEFESPYPRYMSEQREMPVPICNKCQNLGHFGEDCWTACFICSKRGHIASFCPSKDEKLSKKNNPKESEKPKDSGKPKEPGKPPVPGM